MRLRLLGDPAAALAVLDRGVRSAAWREAKAEDRPYLTFATIYAEAGRPARARELVAQWSPPADARSRESQAPVHIARGAIALAEGRPADAIREYHAFRDSVPQCTLCGLAELGRVYDATGQPDSAVAIFERYLTTPMLFRAGLDNTNLTPILRRLAELHEQRGDRQQAIQYYDRLIQLWQSADPVLQPQVAEAKGQLATLLGEG